MAERALFVKIYKHYFNFISNNVQTYVKTLLNVKPKSKFWSKLVLEYLNIGSQSIFCVRYPKKNFLLIYQPRDSVFLISE